MKRLLLLILLAALLALLHSCSTTYDCRGREKHRLPNGVWM